MTGSIYDGIRGRSPIQIGAESIGMGLTQQEYAAKFYSQGVNPGGILTTEQALKKEQVDSLRQELETNGGSVANSHRPLIMHSGMKYQTLAINPTDAALIESMKFSVEQIARFFGVPLQFLQASQATITERDNISFIQNTILPWLVLFEQEIDRQLLTTKDIQQGYTAGFIVTGLFRADVKSQAEALNLYRNNGILSSNDCRDMIGIPPIQDDSGDVLMANGNLRSVRDLVIIRPFERIVPQDPGYRPLNPEISGIMESWQKKLSEDEESYRLCLTV